MNACTIGDCHKQIKSRGMCSAHYWRFQKYGSATVGGKTYRPRGERIAFIDKTIAYDGSDCILWPFSHNGLGYPNFSAGKKKVYAHRAVCESVNGSPPFVGAQVAHSCGNGHLGCITPKHLRWDTPKGNSADTVNMGRTLRGELQPNSELTEETVTYAIKMRGRLSCKSIGAELGVAPQTVHDVWSGKSWSWFTGVTR